MVQLWVNLPAKDKMSEPGYQGILDRDIPTLALEAMLGLRLIAGEYGAKRLAPSSTGYANRCMGYPLECGQSRLRSICTKAVTPRWRWCCGAVEVSSRNGCAKASSRCLIAKARSCNLKPITTLCC